MADPGGARGHAPPIIRDFFSKVRCCLTSFQIFLDSTIDLSNETITFIKYKLILHLSIGQFRIYSECMLFMCTLAHIDIRIDQNTPDPPLYLDVHNAHCDSRQVGVALSAFDFF